MRGNPGNHNENDRHDVGYSLHDIPMTIRDLRKSRKVTQFELARRTRIHPSEISRIESGRLRPTKSELERIAEALHVEPTALAEFVDAR